MTVSTDVPSALTRCGLEYLTHTLPLPLSYLLFSAIMLTRQVLPIPGASIWVKWDMAAADEDPIFGWFMARVHNITSVPSNSSGILSKGTIEYSKTPEYESSTTTVDFLRGSKLKHLPTLSSSEEELDDTPCPWSAVHPDDPFFAAESTPPDEPVTSYPQLPQSTNASMEHVLHRHAAEIAQIKRDLGTLQNSVAFTRSGPDSTIFFMKQRLLWAVMQALQRPLVAHSKKTTGSSQASSADNSAYCGMVRSSIKVTVPCSFALFTEMVRPGGSDGGPLPLKYMPSISSYYLQYNPSNSYDVFSADFRTLGGLFGLQDYCG